MATVIEEFVARLGWDVDTKEIEKFNKSFDRVKNIALGIGKAVSIATGLITGYATVVGRQIAVNTNLAKSVGISVESLEALGGVVENLGMDTERVVDLVEEMNNKLGEKKGLGEFTAVEESLKILRLDFEAIKKLKPEEQFIKIFDAAKALGDQQQAVSAVDMLMGGEANKILGFLRAQDKSLRDILDHRRRLNLLTDDGREATVNFTKALNDLNIVARSFGGIIFASISAVLEPFIQDLIDWVVANKDLIRHSVEGVVKKQFQALTNIFRVLKKVVTWLWKAVEAVGGLDKALFLLGLAVGGLMLGQAVVGIRAFMTAVKAATLVQTLFNAAVAFIPALIALAVVAIGLIAEDFYQFFTGGESVVGDFVEFVKSIWAEMVNYTEGLIDKMVTHWAEAWGMSKEELDGALLASFEALEEFFQEVDKQILSIFEYFENFSGGFGDFIGDIVDKAIGMFRDLKNVAKENIGAIIKFAQGLPIIGGLFGGEPKAAPGKKPAPKAGKSSATKELSPGDLTPTSELFGGDFVMESRMPPPPPSPSPSVINNRGNTTVTQTTKVTAPITVNAQPGQSAVDIGREVQRQLGEQVSAAVRANDTGIER